MDHSITNIVSISILPFFPKTREGQDFLYSYISYFRCCFFKFFYFTDQIIPIAFSLYIEKNKRECLNIRILCVREKMFKYDNSLYFKINFDHWKYLMNYMDSSNEGVNSLFILGSDMAQFQSIMI